MSEITTQESELDIFLDAQSLTELERTLINLFVKLSTGLLMAWFSLAEIASELHQLKKARNI